MFTVKTVDILFQMMSITNSLTHSFTQSLSHSLTLSPKCRTFDPIFAVSMNPLNYYQCDKSVQWKHNNPLIYFHLFTLSYFVVWPIFPHLKQNHLPFSSLYAYFAIAIAIQCSTEWPNNEQETKLTALQKTHIECFHSKCFSFEMNWQNGF